MSERMIELHRARLLAAGKGSKANTGTMGVTTALHQQNGSLSTGVSHQSITPQTPQQSAVTALQNEDSQLKRFLQRLQHERDDSQPIDTSLGPTVPTALSRRMLHRQGAGYYDGTVAAMTSAAADRFLATVLQQAMVCRDKRLKGAEIARQSAKKRRRHKRQYQDSTDDRNRRKEQREALREEINLAAIEAADSLKNKTSNDKGAADSKATESGPNASSSPSKSKKKKKIADAVPLNGLQKRVTDLSDDEASYDSIDEEEEYYDKYYDSDDESHGTEDEDDVLILHDLVRPLAAWDYDLNGKLQTLCDAEQNEPETKSDDESMGDDDENDDGDLIDERDNEAMSIDAIENGVSNNEVSKNNTTGSKKSPNKSPDEKKNPPSRKSSPIPGAAQGGVT